MHGLAEYDYQARGHTCIDTCFANVINQSQIQAKEKKSKQYAVEAFCKGKPKVSPGQTVFCLAEHKVGAHTCCKERFFSSSELEE